MTLTDRYSYCPFSYGYSNYSRPGFARTPFDFNDLVKIAGSRSRTTPGGAGLAASASCPVTAFAVDYVEFRGYPLRQLKLCRYGGKQPGRRSAWTDEVVNASCGDHFGPTLPSPGTHFFAAALPGLHRLSGQCRRAHSRVHDEGRRRTRKVGLGGFTSNRPGHSPAFDGKEEME